MYNKLPLIKEAKNMKQELYNKVSKNIEKFIMQYLDNRDDIYLIENQDRIIKKYINEICDGTKIKMKNCTEKETEAYRTLMGIYNNGEMQTYKQTCQKLNKNNIKQLIFNANRKMMATIYKQMLLEDKVKLISFNIEYQESKGMLLPENIDIDCLSSVIYYEYEFLKRMGIENIKDIIEYTIPEILNIIENLKTKRKSNKKDIAKELIDVIHILGFVFKNEEGYEAQQNYFEKLRTVIKYPSKIYYSDEEINLKKELYLRKSMIEYLNKLLALKQKYNIYTNIEQIDKKIEATKETIIKTEAKIRLREK